VRVIVLAGEGKHFSAGADLQWMQRASQASRDWNVQDARRFAAMLARIDGTAPNPRWRACRVPRWAAAWAWPAPVTSPLPPTTPAFSVSEARFGILPAVIGPYLTNAVGKRQARAWH
jgi:methylglutaconyl-CoA hydratase